MLLDEWQPFINGVDTGVTAVGKDGKDGLDLDYVSPTIELMAIGILAILIQAFLQEVLMVLMVPPQKLVQMVTGGYGEDSEFAQGKDGVTAMMAQMVATAKMVKWKTSYELWKEAVDAGDMTNKDGLNILAAQREAFEMVVKVRCIHCISIGYRKVIQAIWQAYRRLFDCHCDGVTIIVFAPNDI